MSNTAGLAIHKQPPRRPHCWQASSLQALHALSDTKEQGTEGPTPTLAPSDTKRSAWMSALSGGDFWPPRPLVLTSAGGTPPATSWES